MHCDYLSNQELRKPWTNYYTIMFLRWILTCHLYILCILASVYNTVTSCLVQLLWDYW